MKNNKLAIAFMMLTLPLFLTGCIAAAVGGGVAAGAGTVAYIKGELKATEEANIDRAWQATEQAIDQLRFLVINKVHDAVSGEIEARTADNEKIHISLKRKTENLTDISIRVGLFGDEALSRLILDKIQQNLR